jgi:multicomponent Na+:H+ antiporter subunit E
VKKVILTLVAFGLWLLLTWTLNWQNLLVGGIVAITTGLIFGNLYVTTPSKIFQPIRWFWLIVYIPVFVWEMAKANFDVAYRVIHPKMPIQPGIVKVKTNLKSEMAKAFLANSITLTPGTFTVDIKDQFLYIHCINVRHTKLDEASHDIIDRFEKLLMKIFD